MQPVVLWEVLAMTPEFLEVTKQMPEALFAESITIQGRKILGSTVILTASSEEEVGLLLPGLLDQTLLQERPEVVLVKRSGKCPHCKPESGADPNIPISDCPHIRQRRMMTVNQVWKINVARLREAASAANASEAT